jgi:hypothetical protein
MGHQTLVYGVIEVFPATSNRPDADSRTDSALQALPETDDWPFLVRSMFSATSSEHVSVAYMYRVIHFGASLKAVEWEWNEWLAKFERLLSMLDGVAATVHLQTELVGDHIYEWHRKAGNVGSWPPEWEFRGGVRSFLDDTAP